MECAHSGNRGAGRLVKVFIVSDMEGVAGIVKWQQVDGNEEKRSYHEGRKLYTEEINAAVRGAKSAGAKEIVVMDCHGAGGEWTFNSLVPEQLDPSCEYVVQNDWTEYTELLEQGCDAALSSRCTRRRGRLTVFCRTRCRGRRGATCSSTASRSARRESTQRCADSGAVLFCSSPATRRCAGKRRLCSAKD